MMPAAILRTMKGLHWLLLYSILYFILGTLDELLKNWVTPTILAPSSYIYMSPQAVFRWLYFGTMGLGCCFSLLWLWLSRQRPAVSWGWRIFALLDIFTSPLLHYFFQALEYAVQIHWGSSASVPVSVDLIAYGFLLTLVPLAYSIWAVVRARGGRRAADDAELPAAQPTDAQKAPPSGMHWLFARLLTLGAMYVIARIILWGYVQWFIDLYFKSHLSNFPDAVFYIIILSWMLAFLLWVRITRKRYSSSGNWQVGSSVIFVVSIVLLFSEFVDVVPRVMEDLYQEYYFILPPGPYSFSAVHLIVTLALAYLPLLYLRRTVLKVQTGENSGAPPEQS